MMKMPRTSSRRRGIELTMPGGAYLRILATALGGLLAGRARTSIAALYLPDSPARSIVSWAHGAMASATSARPQRSGERRGKATTADRIPGRDR